MIEVIVAFAVLGLALMLLLGTLSNGTRQVRWAADSGRAALHAQSLLDELGIELPLQPGQQDGSFEDGRYRWTLAIAPHVETGVDPDTLDGSSFAPLQPVDPFAPQLLEVALAVEWGEGGPRERLQLHTLRLRTTDAGAGALP
ncbi:general secretion pathway protein GspI [Luteimonas sp. BDR2-5]|uniref:type II secretion system protein XpsI n=1 Tax=Proluteimonas luteida TaxID=2878685 RepID=UPI001E379A4A|nr:general secretion pathway protein GspI [Luteimonas sp. BDR2-5]